jgi:hypothetical protein
MIQYVVKSVVKDIVDSSDESSRSRAHTAARRAAAPPLGDCVVAGSMAMKRACLQAFPQGVGGLCFARLQATSSPRPAHLEEYVGIEYAGSSL